MDEVFIPYNTQYTPKNLTVNIIEYYIEIQL